MPHPILRPLLTLAALLLASAIVSAPAGAQCAPTALDCTNPPAVTITPSGGSWTGSADTLRLNVTIAWCASDILQPPTRSIVLDGRAVTSAFSYTSGASAGCLDYATSAGTIALAPGSHTLQAQIRDAMEQSGSASASYTYTYEAPPPPPDTATPVYRVAVSPDTGSVTVVEEARQTVNFTVLNEGNTTAEYALAHGCTGAGLTECARTHSAVILAAGASATVGVSVKGGQPGSTGSVTLQATRGAVSDGGSLAVGVVRRAAAGFAGDSLAQGRIERGMCLTISVGEGAAYECGDLRLAHGLPGVRVLGTHRAPVLLYNSQHAQPFHVVATDFSPPADRPTPTQVELTITGPVAGFVTSTTFAGWAPGSTRRIAVGVDASSLETGIHPYRLEVVAHYADGTRLAFPQPEGRMVVVNRGKVGNPFGRGWWLAGLEQMVEVSTTERLWVGGDGSARVYRLTAKGEWVAPGFTGPPDTLVARGDTLVRVVQPGRAQVYFDRDGRHVRTVSRLGHQSEFTWNAAGRLTRVSLPTVPGVFDTGYGFGFEYAHPNGLLSRITAPGPVSADVAATAVRVDASGRVTRFVGPMGDSVAFGYGSTARVVTRTDALGYRTDFRYNGGLRLAVAKLHMARPTGGDSIVTRFIPQESRGLPGTGGATTPYGARTMINGARTDTLDYTYITVDRWGAPVRIQDAYGRVTEIGRGDPRFPGLVNRVKHPNGRTVWATYDARGNLASTLDPSITSVDGRFATTLYEWDGKWDVLLRSTLPEGETTEFGYDTLGRPQWVRPAGDPAREVRYEYHPLTDARAPGLVAAVTQPLSVREEYGYDVRGNLELSRVMPRGGDPAGALTIHTTYQNDRIGRVTDVFGASGEVQRRHYDLLGRDTLSLSIGSRRTVDRSAVLQPDLVLPSDTTFVRTVYDAAGQVRSVSRWARPDSTAVGTVTTQWTYDAAGRWTAEIAPDGARDTTAYDPAGNVVWSRDRRGVATRMRYDALSRIIQTTTDSVSYPKFSDAHSTSSASTRWYFPFYEQDAEGNFGTTRTTSWSWSGVLLRGDTATFAYDLAGNLVRADNRDALVRRSYDAAGRLILETQKVRTYAGRDTTKYHVYTLGYGYDLNGRRTWLSHPPGISLSGAADTTRYVYDRATGALNNVAAPRSAAEFFFDYDAEGWLTGQTRHRVVETFHYDPLGRLEQRLETSSGTTVHADTLFHDLRGKTVAAHTNLRVDSLAYSGSGALAWTYGRSRADSRDRSEEVYGTDALTRSYTVLTRSLSPEAPSMDPIAGEYGHISAYQEGTGRLLGTSGGTNAGPSSSNVSYDVAGNRTRSGAQRWVATPYSSAEKMQITGVLSEVTRSYYGGDGRLRVADRRTCLGGFHDNQLPCDTMRAPAFEDRAAFEEYRYDALGRRVLVRSRTEWLCTSYCRNAVMRTVWDGDQVLYEISAPGGSQASAAAMEADTGHTKQLIDHNNVYATRFFPYGRVMYLHGGSLDAPLAFYRMEYSDSLSGPHRVIPHANWRGSYDSGDWNGTCKVITVTDRLVEPPGENDDPEEQDTFEEHCLEVFWPAEHLWSAKQFRVGYNAPRTWMGSLITESRDASGLYYRRNRFYDSETGQFTQEDPIGIAGGLNVYGFADGDPLSYSDPYGLSPEEDDCCRLANPTPRKSPDAPEPEQSSGGVLAHRLSFAAIGQAAKDTWAEHGATVISLVGMAASRGLGGATGPNFVVTSRGTAIRVPSGATGPTPTRAPGVQYTGGSGGPGLDSRVSGVRIMEASARQPARVNYMNTRGQTVDPATGRTISNSDPRGHVPLP